MGSERFGLEGEEEVGSLNRSHGFSDGAGGLMLDVDAL